MQRLRGTSPNYIERIDAALRERLEAQGMNRFALGGNLGFALAPITTTPVLLRTGLHATLLLFIPVAVGGQCGMLAGSVP